jgi:type I restriction enzyme, S subunit
MTLEVLLRKFALFVEAPNAVTKVRELLLELAVRGGLSERVPTDQNDPAWRELAAHSEQGVELAQTSPFEIPDGWRWVRLNDLGQTKVRNNVADETPVSFVPMTLIPSRYGLAPQSEARTWGAVKKAFTHFADGDVVMAKITPCFENGKSAVMRDLIGGVGAGTTELHVFRRSTTAIAPEFALIYLKTRGFITRGEPRMTGSAGQKRVPHDYFAESPFPLPPPAEQKRIVAKVDELMALCDRLEAQQEQRETRHVALARASLARFAEAPTPGNLQFLFHKSYTISPSDLRRSILTLAIQGKLVRQNPDDGTAMELLAAVLNERESHSAGRRPKEPASADGDGEPYDIPATWAWAQLGRIALRIQYGYTASANTDRVAVRMLRITDIQNNRVDWSRVPGCDIEEGEVERYLLAKDDILIARTGGTIGKSFIMPDAPVKSVFASYLIRVTPPRSISAPYLKLALESPLYWSQLRGMSAGTGQPNVNGQALGRLSFPLPPVAEQRRIVAKVDELMAFCDRLESQLAASRGAATNLLDAIVAALTVQGLQAKLEVSALELTPAGS